MPLLFKPIAIFLAMIIGSVIARILFALGLGIVTYTSINTGLDYLEQQVSGTLSGVSGDMLAVMKIAGFAEFMSIIFSAWSAVIAINMITGAVKRITFIPES